MPVNYRPRESSTLDNLLRAMRAGLDPQLGYSLFSGVQGDALARAQAAQAAQEAKQAGRRDTLSSLLDALISQASGGMSQTGASTLTSALGAFPGVGPRMEGRLDDLLGTLYPSQTLPGAVPTGVGPDLARVHPRTAEGMAPTTAPSEFSPLYQQPGADPAAALGQASDLASLVAAGIPGAAVSSLVPPEGPLGEFLQGLFPGGYGEPSSLAQVGVQPLDIDDQSQLWDDAVVLLQGGSSPQATFQQLKIRHGPTLDGHDEEVMALIQRVLTTLGTQAPANVRQTERTYAAANPLSAPTAGRFPYGSGYPR